MTIIYKYKNAKTQCQKNPEQGLVQGFFNSNHGVFLTEQTQVEYKRQDEGGAKNDICCLIFVQKNSFKFLDQSRIVFSLPDILKNHSAYHNNKQRSGNIDHLPETPVVFRFFGIQQPEGKIL